MVETVSTRAYRWKCPAAECNKEQSPIYEDENQVEKEFRSHLQQKHSIEHFIPFILSTAKWQWSAHFSSEKIKSKSREEENGTG